MIIKPNAASDKCVTSYRVDTDARLGESWESGLQFHLSTWFTDAAPLQELGNPLEVLRKLTDPMRIELDLKKSVSQADHAAGDLCKGPRDCVQQLS